jgi:hypothetical protein
VSSEKKKLKVGREHLKDKKINIENQNLNKGHNNNPRTLLP